MAGQIKRLSKARFDALSFSRRPSASWVSEPHEWFADKEETLIAVVLRDFIDDDWVYIVLGRDEAGLFRGIDQKVSLPTQKEARDELRKAIRRIKATGQVVFSQDTKPKKRQELFVPTVPPQRLHPYFVKVASEDEFHSARDILREIGYSYIDPDGNFVEQFQTTGFNSRLWEIYLHAYLHEEEFWVSRDHPYPDYSCTKGENIIHIEAVTVNKSENTGLVEPSPSNHEEVVERTLNYMPIKFGSALFSKLKRRYWESEHIRGQPLVFAIQDFHQDQSMIWSATALPIYLYGYNHKWYHNEKGELVIVPEKLELHRHGEKEIPAGFFFQPDCENISAVIFSNSATIAKFNRMGKLAGFGNPKTTMVRMGARHNPDPNAAFPLPFEVEVNPTKYSESWSEGLAMYHNPNALHPIDPELFPSITHHFFENGQLVSYGDEFHIYSSYTIVFLPKR